ncbi:MAG TPA: VTT domain-containing protein [Bryobacteraceae bacterium]|nr:VTT domain-containing protein [Bryobacteraceae bacterium]
MQETIEFIVRHGYVLLFLWILAEQGALPLPSIPLLLACGALARAGRLSIVAVLFCGAAACLLADNLWFQLGKRRGAGVLRLICRVALEPDSCVRRTENAFLRYGIRSLLISKFVPGLNAIAAPMAGISGAPIGRFLLFDGLGAVIWISAYTFAGYIFSGELERIALYATRMGSGLLLLVVGLLGAWIAWKYIQRKRFFRKLSVARITAEELMEKLDSGEDVTVVDLRSRMDHDTDSIPGAIRLTAEALEEDYRAFPRDREIVLVCS